MLEQLFNIVKELGQDTVVNNPEVPNEYNQEVMADATQTIAGGFKNILAGGGFQNILDLFKGGASAGAGGNAGLLKSPIVSMMVGYFISKLVRKYSMSPSIASNIANSLIPNALNGLIQKTNDPNNPDVNMDGLIGSLVGGGGDTDEQEKASRSPLQDLLEKFTGGGGGGTNSGGGGFDLQDIISKLTQKSQNSLEEGQGGGGGGLMDLIKGFIK